MRIQEQMFVYNAIHDAYIVMVPSSIIAQNASQQHNIDSLKLILLALAKLHFMKQVEMISVLRAIIVVNIAMEQLQLTVQIVKQQISVFLVLTNVNVQIAIMMLQIILCVVHAIIIA